MFLLFPVLIYLRIYAFEYLYFSSLSYLRIYISIGLHICLVTLRCFVSPKPVSRLMPPNVDKESSFLWFLSLKTAI